MTQAPDLDFSFHGLLRCANCGAGVSRDPETQTLMCAACDTRYFSLNGIPCLFPAGEYQQTIWQHQAGMMQAQGQQGLAHVQEAVSRYDLTARTRERLVDTFAALQMSQEATLALLAAAGIEPKLDEQMGQMNPGDLAEYYDLILRDWAWEGSENSTALERTVSVLPDDFKPKRVLVLGAGAGRLSWDMHCALRPECTVALDSNPLLLVVADTLIRQRRAIDLAEFKTFPQMDREVTRTWTMQPPSDALGLRDRWFALGADAWRAPLRAASFDLIVTPWFIDVNGGDVRDTIAVVSQLLAPGGRWLNSGPLLFTRHLPLEQKYTPGEIREFLSLSGFSIESEAVSEADHLDSPLEVRKQHEQLWTFCVLLPRASGSSSASGSGAEVPWLIMHHLPVPAGDYTTTQEHPIIDAILALIDGERSVNHIAMHVAPIIPEGIAPKDLVVTLLGQIVTESASR